MNCVTMPEPGTTSDDAFLGGRLRLTQLLRGHRAGHDAMLLAASVAARPGDVVFDLGAGVGAAGLAVATRVPGIDLTLLEINPDLCALASENAARNRIAASVVNADVTDRAAFQADRLVEGSADAVLMNPPFNDARHHQASPDDARRRAHIAEAETLNKWTKAASRLLKARGSLTLIWRADGLAEVLAALADGFGGVTIQPVHSVGDKPALRVLVRAVKGSRAPLSVLRGLMLDGSDARIERALKGQGGLPLAECDRAASRRASVTAEPSRSSGPVEP